VLVSDDEQDEKARKERVIHTRVPAVLEQELKRLAESLKVPVSNVVRTILEDAVAAVDSVGQKAEGELRQAAERLSRHRSALKRATSAPLAGIVGYQALMLARAEKCALCDRPLAAGEEGFLGIRDGIGPRVILGKECLPFSAAGGDDKEERSP
jgi:hypothetical protein